MPLHCPQSIVDVNRWAQANGTSHDAARRRFVQFCVLDAVGSDDRLSRILILRGSAALQLVYGGVRDCDDVDLIVMNIDGGPICGDADPDAPKPRLTRALGARLPLHFGGDELWEQWLKLIKVQFSQAECVYDVRQIKLTTEPGNPAFGQAINVSTLEVLIAEKVTAMAHAVFRQRTRHREQDVFDLASLIAAGATFDERRVAELVRRRAIQHRFDFDRKFFGDAGRAYIGGNYEYLRTPLGGKFIEFEAAWAVVLRLVDRVIEIQRDLPPLEPEVLLRSDLRSVPRPKTSYVLAADTFAPAEPYRSLGGGGDVVADPDAADS